MKNLILFLIAVSIVVAQETVKVKVVCNGRENPSPQAKRIMLVHPGEYKVTDIFSYWVFVEVVAESLNIGHKGWVCSLWLDKIEGIAADTYTVRKPGLHVRKNPDKNSEKICLLKEGAIVGVKKKMPGWYKIIFLCEQVWIWEGNTK